MEDYPSPAEGNGLENRQVCKSTQGFESLILLFQININIIAGWSSWQLVGLITRRSQVQVLSPQFIFFIKDSLKIKKVSWCRG